MGMVQASTRAYVPGFLLFIVLTFMIESDAALADPPQWDLKSDTWVANDALGRKLPGYAQCGPPRAGKTVGIFYLLWHGAHGTYGPYNITDILDANPDALKTSASPPWGPLHLFHHWDESELGYYLSNDEYVIRKHWEMLTQAGVDVLVLDATNNPFTYKTQYMLLCQIYQNLRNNGFTTPKICWFARVQNIETIYNDFYAQNYYPDLWYHWDGKPLFLLSQAYWQTDPEPNATLQSFFTIRKMWAWSGAWSGWFGDGQDKWLWHDNYPQDYGWHDDPQIPEETAVSVAMQETYMTAPTAHGRHYHNGSQPPQSEWTGQGDHFAEQWERALEIDPEFIFINEWNEWIAQRFVSGVDDDGIIVPPGYTYFVDQFNQEFSRDVEPMKGGHTDNYYYQMIAGIRRYKGVRPPEVPSDPVTIAIDGAFNDWTAIQPEYRDSIGDTLNRNHGSWASGTYTKTSGRNDIIVSKAAYDANSVFFYAKTNQTLTAYTGSNWMLLFIDADADGTTGWEGYDYLVNSPVVSATQTTLKQWNGSSWSTISSAIPYRAAGNELEIRLSRSSLGLAGGLDAALDFNFHWADNIQTLGDITQFFNEGDSAPDRRFNYRYYVRSVEPAIDLGTNDIKKGLRRIVAEAGNTTSVTIGGRECRRNDDPGVDRYIYFDVDDLFAYAGSRANIDVAIDYYDTGSGSLVLQYDSSTGSSSTDIYKTCGGVPLRGTNTWKTHLFHITDAYFGNRQNGGADFRIAADAGTTFYLDVVATAWAIGNVDIDLGNPDLEQGLVLVDASQGNTQVVNIGGRECRRNYDPQTDWYIYFAVDDYFAYKGNKSDRYITFEYFDNGLGTYWVSYDSSDPGGWPNASYKSLSTDMAGTQTWKRHFFHVTDAYFGNRQNGGADMRFWRMDETSEWRVPFYLDTVVVSEESPMPTQAFNPNPDHQATKVSVTADLSWSAERATSYDVYFGTTNPPPFQSNQTETVFDPGQMEVLTPYYWRIDTINDLGSTPGQIWSFTTEASPGDMDEDHDVDQEDFGRFQACFSGSGRPYLPGCEDADFNSDNDVDQDDFNAFRACMRGANLPPGC